LPSDAQHNLPPDDLRALHFERLPPMAEAPSRWDHLPVKRRRSAKIFKLAGTAAILMIVGIGTWSVQRRRMLTSAAAPSAAARPSQASPTGMSAGSEEPHLYDLVPHISAFMPRAPSEATLRDKLKANEILFGPDSPATIESRRILAFYLVLEHKNAEAEMLLRNVIQSWEKISGPTNRLTLQGRDSLALALAYEGKKEEAENEFRAVLKLEEQSLGAEDPQTLATSFHFASCLREAGKIQEALAFAQRAVDGARKVLGPDNLDRRQYENLLQQLSAGKPMEDR
jgi:tetratricopeptide (TPR) repeat protein